MKPKLTIGLSILICLVLLAFGLVYGNVGGYNDDRNQVNALLNGDSGLVTVLNYRASDGLNLCVVADRHLSADSDVAALRVAANAVRQTSAPLSAVKANDTALENAFATVAAKLRASQSFLASARDKQYLDMLTTDFQNYGASPMFNTYNAAAATFNKKLTTPVLGDVARFFGVKAVELYP